MTSLKKRTLHRLLSIVMTLTMILSLGATVAKPQVANADPSGEPPDSGTPRHTVTFYLNRDRGYESTTDDILFTAEVYHGYTLGGDLGTDSLAPGSFGNLPVAARDKLFAFDNYNFSSWGLAAGAGNDIDSTYVVNADTNVYARYRSGGMPPTTSFDPGGSDYYIYAVEYPGAEPVQYASGGPYGHAEFYGKTYSQLAAAAVGSQSYSVSPLTAPTRDGYTFDHWATYTAYAYTQNVGYTNLEPTYASGPIIPFGTESVFTENTPFTVDMMVGYRDLVIFGVWTPLVDPVTVTLFLNAPYQRGGLHDEGVTGWLNNQRTFQIERGSTLAESAEWLGLATPDRQFPPPLSEFNEYVFDHWADDFHESSPPVNVNVPVNDDLDLYAMWEGDERPFGGGGPGQPDDRRVIVFVVNAPSDATGIVHNKESLAYGIFPASGLIADSPYFEERTYAPFGDYFLFNDFFSEDPTSDNYTFLGWYSDVDGNGEQLTKLTMAEGGLDIDPVYWYGKWELKPAADMVTVTLYLNVPDSGTAFFGSSDTRSFQIERGTTLADSAVWNQIKTDVPEVNGDHIHFFDGWYYDYETTLFVQENAPVNEDLDLFALYTETNWGGGGGGGGPGVGDHWWVVYDVNAPVDIQGLVFTATAEGVWPATVEVDDPNPPVPSPQYNGFPYIDAWNARLYGDTYRLNRFLDEVPTSDNYDFVGWFEDSEFTIPITIASSEVPGAAIGGTTVHVVYGKWELKGHTVNFHLNNDNTFAANNDIILTIKVPDGQTIGDVLGTSVLPDPYWFGRYDNVVEEWKRYLGWGTGTASDYTLVNANLEVYGNTDLYVVTIHDDFTMEYPYPEDPGGDLDTVIAIPYPGAAPIYLGETAYGWSLILGHPYNEFATLPLPQDLTRDGYTFAGWKTYTMYADEVPLVINLVSKSVTGDVRPFGEATDFYEDTVFTEEMRYRAGVIVIFGDWTPNPSDGHTVNFHLNSDYSFAANNDILLTITVPNGQTIGDVLGTSVLPDPYWYGRYIHTEAVVPPVRYEGWATGTAQNYTIRDANYVVNSDTDLYVVNVHDDEDDPPETFADAFPVIAFPYPGAAPIDLGSTANKWSFVLGHQYNEFATISLPTDLLRDGYTFAGWKTYTMYADEIPLSYNALTGDVRPFGEATDFYEDTVFTEEMRYRENFILIFGDWTPNNEANVEVIGGFAVLGGAHNGEPDATYSFLVRVDGGTDFDLGLFTLTATPSNGFETIEKNGGGLYTASDFMTFSENLSLGEGAVVIEEVAYKRVYFDVTGTLKSGIVDFKLAYDEVEVGEEYTVIIPGDVNKDGNINGADVSIEVGFVMNVNPKPTKGKAGGYVYELADVLKDDSINGADISRLAGLLFGAYPIS